MTRIVLRFDYADKDIADIIANSKPPPGVTVGRPAVFIQASTTGGVFTQIVIQVAQIGRDVLLMLLAAWLYDRCKQSGK